MSTDYRQRLFIVFNRAVSTAKKKDNNPKLIERLYKALGILQSFDYYQAERAQYQPTITHCNCDDWKYHNAAKRQYQGHCKHMIAEVLWMRMQQLTYKQLDFFNVM